MALLARIRFRNHNPSNCSVVLGSRLEAPMKRIKDLSPRKLPTQARAHATCRAVVEAAARILEERGYEALTTNHVAAEAGVGIASLYEYFPNKQSVVAAVVTVTVEDILADLRGALENAASEPPEVGLGIWVGAMFAAVDKRRAIAGALIR